MNQHDGARFDPSAQARHEPAQPHHPDVAVWRPASIADIDLIHGVLAAADRVDHPAWTTTREEVADTFAVAHIDHARDTLIAEDADGVAIAVGSVMLHPSRDARLLVDLPGAVVPTARRRGIGAALLAWQIARGRQQVAEVGARGIPAELRVFAEEGNRDHQSIAARHGLEPRRWFASMERDLASGVASVTPPDGVTVQPLSPELFESARLARNDAFRDHWGSLPTPPETWAQLTGGEHFRADLSRVVIDADDRVAAFCLVTVNEDDWVARGVPNAYIDLIGVVRAHRGRGLAPLVISHALAAIAAAGLKLAILDVDTESPTGANTLYDRLGFVVTDRSIAHTLTIEAETP